MFVDDWKKTEISHLLNYVPKLKAPTKKNSLTKKMKDFLLYFAIIQGERERIE